MDILEGLNKEQKEAVLCTEGPCLIIAGAGSGKTKVLTHKIAYLIGEKNVKPWDILAFTFTNKAANEMRSRVESLVGDAVNDMWIGTFHSICVRILRKQIDRIGFDTSFVIFDTSDQKTLVKQILKSKNIDDKIFTDKTCLYEISNAKNDMIEPDRYAAKVKGDLRREKIAEVYEEYQKRLKENNAIDFDDIINFTIKIFLDNPDVLEYYSGKFKYVLVDEYQDTNKAQFTLITLLASKHGNITVVGDNDQGIYSFRGADITNILNFEKDFPGSKIIKLEQNYRCTQNILNAANEVIKNNETKYEKKLWTENDKGTLPKVFRGDNEYSEATFIVSQINSLKMEEYYHYNDFAVLYRMNSQSRAIEDILRREDIPYKIVGGLKFYERKEIKDIIAYLRLIQNTNDNLSLTRIINEPKRGVGKTSLDNIDQIAAQNGTSMYEIIKNADKYGLSRVFANTREFVNTIEDLRARKDDLSISELITQTLHDTGYSKALEIENTVEAETRIQNLEEFLTVAIEFEEEEAENNLAEFLEGITLSSDIDGVEDTDDSVTLMTLHSAKGLEEERRLCYVGITRAKEHLFMTCAKQRTIFGSTSCNGVSRFVREIPESMLDGADTLEDNAGYAKVAEDYNDYEWSYGGGRKYVDFEPSYDTYKDIERKGSREKVSTTFQFRTADSFLKSLNNKPKSENVDLSQYKAGVRVNHKKFGEGTIDKVEPEGEDLKVDITFDKVGHKRLMAKFAGLTVID